MLHSWLRLVAHRCCCTSCRPTEGPGAQETQLKDLAKYLMVKRNKFSHMGVFICADTRVRVTHELKVPGSQLHSDGHGRSTYVRSGLECIECLLISNS